MGINTGYCNVGNFGSDDRMDYTIIGAEANLAARLQIDRRARRHLPELRDLRAGARPGARRSPLPPITMKGISREVVPYAVEGLLGELAQRPQVISEHATGLDLFLDLDAHRRDAAPSARSKRLSEALLALTVRSKAGAV